MAKTLPDTVLDSVRDGTFPSSDDVLTAEVSQDVAALIYARLSEAKEELSKDIRDVSRRQAGDVDTWIALAKQVQQDIAQCKTLAREIVEEHEKGRDFVESERDSLAKQDLLNGEISFTSALSGELEEIHALNQQLLLLGDDIAQSRLIETAADLGRLRATLDQRRPSRVNALFAAKWKQSSERCLHKLRETLSERIIIYNEAGQISMTVEPDARFPAGPSFDNILSALQQLGSYKLMEDELADRLEKSIIRPFLSSRRVFCSSVEVRRNRLLLVMDQSLPDAFTVLANTQRLLRYLHDSFPAALQTLLGTKFMPQISIKLRTVWLDEAVPVEVSDLSQLDQLRDATKSLADDVTAFDWPGAEGLFDWCSQIPETWLARRRLVSLQRIRSALNGARGPLRKVERVEKEIVRDGVPVGAESDQRLPSSAAADGEPWDDEEDASGWDFDEEDEEKEGKTSANEEHDPKEADAGEAWGWDDEDEAAKTSSQLAVNGVTAANGHRSQKAEPHEVTLVETFSITDIPDHILDTISRDVSDAQSLKQVQHSALHSIDAVGGLQSIPDVVLSMFRAVAPTYYSETFTSGNMQLYNDSVYTVQKLRESDIPDSPNTIETGCRAMEKFARGAYARELDTQRTILGDLLDGAQGFVNCTQPPNSTECENAMAAVIDRIRAVNDTWKVVLSTSTLLQAVGSLLSAVIGKIIDDVEDMEDISEPQSQRLTTLFERLKNIEDLFTAPSPSVSNHPSNAAEAEVIPQTALFCPKWLKFTYLIDLLDSNLEDIKFMWTHGMLGMEYDQGEVIDLVRALFADSPHRRNFVSDIKRIEPGSQWEG